MCRGAEPLGVGTSATCYYEAYVRVHVFEALNMSNSGFLPPEMYWGEIAPTWFDNTYRHLIVQVRCALYCALRYAAHGVFVAPPGLAPVPQLARRCGCGGAAD